jgi:hypothetical protein
MYALEITEACKKRTDSVRVELIETGPRRAAIKHLTAEHGLRAEKVTFDDLRPLLRRD